MRTSSSGTHQAPRAAVVTVRLVLLLSLAVGLAAGCSPKAIAGNPAALQRVAQAAPGPSGSAPTAAGEPVPGGDLVAAVDTRIAELHATLHITPAQEPAFAAFAAVMRANARAMQALFLARAHNSDTTAAGLLHGYARLTTAHAEALNKLVPVFDTLYRSLTTAQKQAADAAFLPLRQRVPPRKAG